MIDIQIFPIRKTFKSNFRENAKQFNHLKRIVAQKNVSRDQRLRSPNDNAKIILIVELNFQLTKTL